MSLIEDKAAVLREEIIKMLTIAGTGHSAGPLGSADFWACLYWGGFLRYKPEDPWWEERDRLILSAGHYAPVLYATLALSGYFPKEELSTLRQLGSRLQGHPVSKILPGIETSSGPLGQGISQAVGMALSGKLEKKKWRVVCFMGDGEQQEGQVWEAYLAAAKYKLDNLLVVVDRNNIQIDGHTENVMPLGDLVGKLASFGFATQEVDGHNLGQLKSVLEKFDKNRGRPFAVVMKTVPGKDVSFMENNPDWHGKVPAVGEAVQALSEIRRVRTLNGTITND